MPDATREAPLTLEAEVRSTASAKCFEPARSSRGVVPFDPKCPKEPVCGRLSVLLRASSRLRILLPLFGVNLVLVRRLEVLPLGGSMISVGLTTSSASAQAPEPRANTALEGSIALSLPLLLSLRRSRIPFALRFRTAGLRNKALVDESRRAWVGCVGRILTGVSVTDEDSSLTASGPFRTMLLVSMWSGKGPLDRFDSGISCLTWSSSLQSAGVGGTGPRLVPLLARALRVRKEDVERPAAQEPLAGGLLRL